MNILFICEHANYFRHMEPLLWPLHFRDHKLKLWIEKNSENEFSSLPVSKFLLETKNEKIHYLTNEQYFLGSLLTTTRNLLGYSVYLNPKHSSPFLKDRFKGKMDLRAQKIVNNHLLHSALSKKVTQQILRNVENIIPPIRKITQTLSEIRPDLVVVFTNLKWNTTVVDYLKAAKSQNIPTIMVVASWDNLTTKSTFQIIPDAVFVWNEALANEAVTLHNIPRKKICVTGAQTFDYLFDMKPSCTYQDFCQKHGIQSDKPFILYVGSSSSISGDETDYARKFISNLKCKNDFSIILRPHPLNAQIWDNFSVPNLVVSPKGGVLPIASADKQDFFDVLFYTKAIVGVNTSALLEAAVMDKPCVTIMAGEYVHAQEENGHFQHLLQADFIEIARDFGDAGLIIERILIGENIKAKQRNAFVRDFIRPLGIEHNVGEIMADMIEKKAGF